MNNNIDINQNKSDCLWEKTNLTESVVHNVCTGEITHVPHGTADYFLGGFVVMLVLAVVAIVALLLSLPFHE